MSRKALAAAAMLELPGERGLVLAAKQDRGEARHALIAALTPLISGLAKPYRGTPGVRHAELMQEGAVGTLRALARYDPDRGTPFWAYASWWVRDAMQQLVAELSRPVVLSGRAATKLARLQRARRAHLRMHGREATARELARDTGIELAQVESLIVADRTPRSLDDRLNADVSGQSEAFGERLADPRAEEAYEYATSRLEAGWLRAALCGLPPMEQAVLRGHYGLGGRWATLRELGAELGMTAEGVRQVEKRALDNLRVTAMQGVAVT